MSGALTGFCNRSGQFLPKKLSELGSLPVNLVGQPVQLGKPGLDFFHLSPKRPLLSLDTHDIRLGMKASGHPVNIREKPLLFVG